MAGRQTLIGSVVLGLAAIALGALVVWGDVPLPGAGSEAVVVFESPTNGLDIGSPVNFRGLPVGAVKRLSVQVDPAHAPGRGDLPPLHELISHGLRAEMALHSLVTGQTEIDLDLSPSTPALLHPGLTNVPEIPMGQTALQQLETMLVATSIKQLHHDLQTALLSVRKLAADVNRDLPGVLSSVRTTSAHAETAARTLRATVEDLKDRSALTINALDRLIVTNNSQFVARRAELRTLITNTRQTMAQARHGFMGLRALMDPQSRDSLNLADTMRDVMEAGYGLRGFANEVTSNPQLLLMGRNQ